MGSNTIKLIKRVRRLLSAVGIGGGFLLLFLSVLDVAAQSWTYDTIVHTVTATPGATYCTIDATISGRQLWDGSPDDSFFTIGSYYNGALKSEETIYPDPDGTFATSAQILIGTYSGACPASFEHVWYSNWGLTISTEDYPPPTPTAIPDPTSTAIVPFTVPTNRVSGLVAIPTAIPIPTIPPSTTLLDTDQFWDLENYESMISITQSMFNFAFFNEAWEIAGFLLMAYLGIRLIINFASRGNEYRRSRQREEV